MITNTYIRSHKVSLSLFIYVSLMVLLHVGKPACIYNDDGSFRQFGIGYRNKSIVPIWLISILLAIFSYLVVIYYIAYYT